MNLVVLRAELLARGFDYLPDLRADRFLNDAMHELDDMHEWPYREATVAGAVPLSIPDLGMIESVYATATLTVLGGMDRRSIMDAFPDLSATGTPSWYYLTAGNAVQTYPVATSSVTVKYWKVAPDMVSGTDAPLSPARFHGLIVDLAVRRAYIDKDNFTLAQALQGDVDRRLAVMTSSLLLASDRMELIRST